MYSTKANNVPFDWYGDGEGGSRINRLEKDIRCITGLVRTAALMGKRPSQSPTVINTK